MKKKKLVLSLVLGLGFSMFAFAENADAAKNMHRLYNPNSGEHFYTADTNEKNNILKHGWRYEGIAWTAPDSGDNVYRLYNPNSGEHHYTTGVNEKNHLVKLGWRYEGVGWKSDTYKGQALYRLYNPNGGAGSHHYTKDKNERSHLLKVGWRNENIGWFGMNPAQKFNIVIVHKGSDGKQLSKQTVAVKRDNNYTAKSKTFSGYTLKGAKTQTVKADKAKTITFNYTKNAVKPPATVQKFKVTVVHKGSDGKVLETESPVSIEKGKKYTAKAKTFSGYYGSKTATQTITVTKDSTITFMYAKKDPANKTMLQKLYDEVKATQKGNYTDASWNTFQTALTTTKNVLANSTWQQEIDDTWWKLNNAFKGLVENTTPVQKYNVTVVHKGNDGVTLQTEPTVSIEKGKQFTAYSKTFNGYTLNGNSSQTVTVNANATITFNYTKNVVEEDLIALENQINSQALANINAHRQNKGKSALKFNAILQKASTIRSRELAVKFDHIRPNGTDSSTVAEDLGYDKLCWNENIYQGGGTMEWLKTYGAKRLVNAWIESAGHNATLLSNYDIEAAVGVYIRDNGGGHYSLFAVYTPGEPRFSSINAQNAEKTVESSIKETQATTESSSTQQ